MPRAKQCKKLVIFGDLRKEAVDRAIREFQGFVKGKADIAACCAADECSLETLKQSHYAVVFGGDGSIISAARTVSPTDVPIIGVNLGKLGFLAEFSVEELKLLLEKVIHGQLNIERRMMLACEVFTEEGRPVITPRGFHEMKEVQERHLGTEIFHAHAVNDIFITAGPPFRMIELEIFVNGQCLASCTSDGLIVATPTGSTAYNLSAGGPILTGSLKAIVVTPICAHSLSFRPIVIDPASTVEIVASHVNSGTTISIDGQVPWNFGVDDMIRIQKAENDFLVVNNPLRNCFETLATKLGWAGRPRYEGS